MAWLDAIKEKKAEEELLGFKLTKSEMAILKEAKKKDSLLRNDYVKKLDSEYDRVLEKIRERKSICAGYMGGISKRDWAIGIGVGLGAGIALSEAKSFFGINSHIMWLAWASFGCLLVSLGIGSEEGWR